MGHSPLGLSTTQDGTTIAPAPSPSRPAGASRCASACWARTGRRCAAGFEVEAQRRLHLIVVRRDLTGYQHLHPAMAADGTWSVPLKVAAARCLPRLRRLPARLPEARAGRRPARRRAISGRLRCPRRAPTASTDGYDVRLERRRAARGPRAALRFTVSRGGRPVREIQPYLGARGHLVALRQGDLAYLHVAPRGARATPPARFRSRPTSSRRAPTACSCSSRSTGSSTPRAFTVEVAP